MGFIIDLIIATILLILPNGILLDTTQTTYIAKLLNPSSPFSSSFMFIYLPKESLITWSSIVKDEMNIMGGTDKVL